jgi:hypothetical protein
MVLPIFKRIYYQDTKDSESDYYIQDASYCGLDNVSVGYTFNQKQMLLR